MKLVGSGKADMFLTQHNTYTNLGQDDTSIAKPNIKPEYQRIVPSDIR